MLNILYLINKQTYMTKCLEFVFHVKLGKLTKLYYSGIGWDNFDNNLTVQENINKMTTSFDMVIVYKPERRF